MVEIWNRQGQLLKTLTGHDGGILSVRWSSDGRHLASSSYDSTVINWNTATWEPEWTHVLLGIFDDLAQPVAALGQGLGQQRSVTVVQQIEDDVGGRP